MSREKPSQNPLGLRLVGSPVDHSWLSHRRPCLGVAGFPACSAMLVGWGLPCSRERSTMRVEGIIRTPPLTAMAEYTIVVYSGRSLWVRRVVGCVTQMCRIVCAHTCSLWEAQAHTRRQRRGMIDSRLIDPFGFAEADRATHHPSSHHPPSLREACNSLGSAWSADHHVRRPGAPDFLQVLDIAFRPPPC